MGEVVYTSKRCRPTQINHVLVVHCSDPYYLQATAEFLSHLGLSHYDPVILPGGAANLLPTSLSYLPVRSSIKMLAERHQIKKVVAIAHSECAYYTLKYPSYPLSKIAAQQKDDLWKFAKEIHALIPGAKVELYMVRYIGDEFQFEQVSG